MANDGMQPNSRGTSGAARPGGNEDSEPSLAQGAAGALVAVALCCGGPLLLVGFGSALLSTVSEVGALRLALIAAAVTALALVLWKILRKPAPSCESDIPCTPKRRRTLLRRRTTRRVSILAS